MIFIRPQARSHFHTLNNHISSKALRHSFLTQSTLNTVHNHQDVHIQEITSRNRMLTTERTVRQVSLNCEIEKSGRKLGRRNVAIANKEEELRQDIGIDL